MVEVLKTNVAHPHEAAMLIDEIHKVFTNYIANFDLEDCDKILRVKCTCGLIKTGSLISLLNSFGFHAEMLPDDPFYLEFVNARMGSLSGTNQLN